MVCLYEKNATASDWADTLADGSVNPDKNNGLCILSPSVCGITEIAGGQYELYMVHPLDDHGKWMMLTEERLIKAPTPFTHIKQITMPELKVYKTTAQTDVYSRTPKKTHTNKNWQTIQTVKDHQSAYTWSPVHYYNAGAVVLSSGKVYRANRGSYGEHPGNFYAWSYIGSLSDANETMDSGTVLETLSSNTKVYRISDAGSGYVRIRTLSGNTGYVTSDSIELTTERYQETFPAQNIRSQVFRIYEVSCDEETNTVSVRAKHISYDFARNGLYDCKVTNEKAVEAISTLQNALMMDDDRKIVCNNTKKKITKDWSFKNPLNALLDPDDGMLNVLNARLIRNNNDFYLLKGNSNNGITIEYGVNMLGVTWTRSVENRISRVIPRSGNSQKGYKYLKDGGRIAWDSQNEEYYVQDQNKNYVESIDASTFAKPVIYVMNCSYMVGQKYEKADGTEATYSESDVLDKMMEESLEKFTDDHIDGVDITLDVQFLLLGDTEEYKQYKGLQRVNLYDIVTVKTGKSGIDAQAKVTEYDFDCLRLRYNSIKLGTINSFKRRVPGYRVVNESITYEKLSADLIDRITTDNASQSSDGTGDGGTSTSGDGQDIVAAEVVDNLSSTSTTKALSANMGRSLNNSIDGLAAKIPCLQVNVTFSSGSNNGTGTSGTFSNARDYEWVATQNTDSTSNFYTGIFVEGIVRNASSITVYANRSLRNDSSGSLTIPVMCIGRKP